MGKQMKRSEMASLAVELGHTGLAVVRNGFFYELTCECGYRSTGRATLNEAVHTGRYHLEKAVAKSLANGRVSQSGAARIAR
jgi:hypothetical protein